jgi:hypothetical protein
MKTMNDKDILLKAFDDAMDLLTRREIEEYNRLEEEKDHMWMQAIDDDAAAIKEFLELLR